VPIHHIKKEIKRHRPIDWFAIAVLISFAFVVISILANKLEEFTMEMDREAEISRAYNLHIKQLKALRLDQEAF